MKIVFISNRLTPHQIPFCNALCKDNLFFFVETMKETVVEIGWYADGSEYPYVIPYTEDAQKVEAIQKMVLDADVVITGSAPDSMIIPRLKAGKITFKYAERFYKNRLGIKTIPRAVIGAWLHHGRFQRYPLYMLCASAFTAADCSVFHNYIGRTYKWGYFPDTKYYDIADLLAHKKKNTILWAGRFLDWKHPDDALQIAKRLKDEGYDFHMDIVGTGEMEAELKGMADTMGLGKCVTFPGSMPPDEVRSLMEQAGIYLFTSDRNEGWGAVLNESMNSGCAVVASHAIGSVPYLMKHNENGLVYHSEDLGALYGHVKYLLDNPSEQERLGKAAYETITGLWNAEVAAQRLITLSGRLLAGEEHSEQYAEGPCSKAEILQDDWF